MSSIKLANRLKSACWLRCRYWHKCGASDCYYYDVHTARLRDRVLMSPVRYCSKVRGFVHDIPANESNPDVECDPNVAFKIKISGAEALEKVIRP